MGAARAQVSNDAAVLRALWSWNRTPASGNSMQCMSFPPRSVAGVELGHRQRCCEAARPQKLSVGSSASLATGHWNPQHLFQKLTVLTLPSSHSGKDLTRIQRPLTARPGPYIRHPDVLGNPYQSSTLSSSQRIEKRPPNTGNAVTHAVCPNQSKIQSANARTIP